MITSLCMRLSGILRILFPRPACACSSSSEPFGVNWLGPERIYILKSVLLTTQGAGAGEVNLFFTLGCSPNILGNCLMWRITKKIGMKTRINLEQDWSTFKNVWLYGFICHVFNHWNLLIAK